MVQDFLQLIIALMPQALHAFPELLTLAALAVPRTAVITVTEHNYSDLVEDCFLNYFLLLFFFN